jgi:hypothetical protein
MLYAMMSSLGSRIVCWQFEQIVIYDVLTRQSHFYTDYRLERQFSAFALVSRTVYLIGGRDEFTEDSRRQIIPYTFDSRMNFAALDCRYELQVPRLRATALSDSQQYIYVLGTSVKPFQRSVEKFCAKTGQVEAMADLPVEVLIY